MKKINSEKIRNFSIIAHIDHGKSTLADRFLEITNFKGSKMNKERILDDLSLEKEKGITIKLNSVQLYYNYKDKNKNYIFNLIDTPGHVDFMYEVSRSLAACEGVLLLIDATKGIQAQTLSYYEIAKSLKLKVIPVINKIDSPLAKLDVAKKQIIELIDCKEKDICMISAKFGKNIELLMENIISFIPPPNNKNGPLKALIFDLLYNQYYGVIVYLRIFEGEMSKGQKIFFHSNKKIFKVERLGVKLPKEQLKEILINGEIGWFTANIRDIKDVKVGDTVFEFEKESLPMKGYKEIKPNVYSNIYPLETSDYKNLKNSLEQLQIQDSSLIIENVDSQLLGRGFRCGFLGSLHCEIINQRIKKEYGCKIINTIPSINYQITFSNGSVSEINNFQKIKNEEIKSIKESFINIIINTPKEYIGKISQLCNEKRGIYKSQEWKSDYFYQIIFDLPFSEFIIDFHDKIKSISRGYASFNYEILGFFSSDIVKVDILLKNQIIPDLSFLVFRKFAQERSRNICSNIKENLRRQNFIVPIQACIGNKIIARETLGALSKNVTGNMYGGDRTRKMKKWKKQEIGKKKSFEKGVVNFSSNDWKKLLKGDD